MKITVGGFNPAEAGNALLATGVFEGENISESGVSILNDSIKDQLQAAVEAGDFGGKSGQSLMLYGGKSARRVMVLGLGKREEIDCEAMRRAFGSAGKFARSESITDIAMVMSLSGLDNGEALIQAALEGYALATYRYSRFFTEKPEDHKNIEQVVLYAADAKDLPALENTAAKAAITIDATWTARDLATTPAQDLDPHTYAEVAKELESDTTKVEILDAEKLEELGMNGILSVGRGSAVPPCLIHISYDPGIENAKTFAIIGKGITFDSGGLDLKPAASMRDMKIDMSGSAAVMGLMGALDEWKPNCRVEAFIPAAENMTGEEAYHPGDVITSYRGLTVEVDNTDAEGRLVMMDALAYAVDTVNPDTVVDIATLTGACWIGLGVHATGMMGTDDELKKLLVEAGNETGERVWELPLWDDYKKQLKSQIADMKNTGGRPGGAITAGIFLKQFVKDTPWIHLDIAGSSSEISYSYVPHGEFPTGVGARLLLDVIKRWA